MELITSDIIILMISAFLTSALAGVIGQGGGLILFVVFASYIDLPLLIAFHAVIQIFSNSSRAYYAINDIKWETIVPILLGIIIGAILITPLVNSANWSWLEPLIALYILQQTWINWSFTLPFPAPLFSIGIIQGLSGMLFGATGPLANSLLLKQGLKKDQIVASNAVIMTVSHLVKVLIFLWLGVNAFLYWPHLIVLGVCAIVGSKVGSHYRNLLSEQTFKVIFKWTLTLLALKMLTQGLGLFD